MTKALANWRKSTAIFAIYNGNPHITILISNTRTLNAKRITLIIINIFWIYKSKVHRQPQIITTLRSLVGCGIAPVPIQLHFHELFLNVIWLKGGCVYPIYYAVTFLPRTYIIPFSERIPFEAHHCTTPCDPLLHNKGLY